MMNATERPVPRHPWLDALIADPVTEFGDLVAGYAPISPYTRADAPDAARMLFHEVPENDSARVALSEGALEWLDTARLAPLPDDPPSFQNHVRQVREAFEIVALLRVAPAGAVLRQGYPKWLDWTNRMVLDSSRDARAAFWSMLARTQGVVADRVTHPDRLAPLWMRLCREVGSGALPERYLDIGLLGLRRLPGAIKRGDTPWIAGIAAWALARNPSEAEFREVWLPFKRWYPTTPANLRKQIVNVLAQKTYADAGIAAPGWWDADPDVARGQAGLPARTLGPPALEDLEALLKKIKKGVPFANLKNRLDQLVHRYWEYTERTGDTYFLIRSFHRLGKTLISVGDDAPDERSRMAEALAREVLSYEPTNLFAWSLWRDALAARGALDAARALGWEMVRRFPEDPNSRTQLADLLAKEVGALDEAEAVARETIRQFPDNAYARNQLAELLLAMERTDEAAKVVDAAISDGVANAVTYAILARLRAHEGDIEGARQAVERGLQLNPNDGAQRSYKGMLERGDIPPLVSTAYRRLAHQRDSEPGDAIQDDMLRSGRLRAIRDRIGQDQDALAELKAILDQDPNFAYARLLAARHKLWDAQSQAMPTVAEAFESALASGDPARLEALAEKAPRLVALILLARALFGDADAAREITRRLRNVDEHTRDRGLRILGVRLRVIIDGIDAGGDPLDLIHANDNLVRQALYDANEALTAQDVVAA